MRIIFKMMFALTSVSAISAVSAQQQNAPRVLLRSQNAKAGAQTFITLAFREFFDSASSADELRPSAKLLGLNHRRVRLVGFMAQMEEPPVGAFYLCAQPVYCDEEGGGTADLPPARVRVVVRSAAQREIAFTPRPLAVTGTLEIDQQNSVINLILDGPQNLTKPPKSQRVKR